MANFPFKTKHYYDLTGDTYDNINFNEKYYTIIGGKLVAIKPIVQFFERISETSSPRYFLYVLAADGKNYKLDSCCKIFRNYDEYVADVHNPNRYDYSKFGKLRVNEVLKRIPGIHFNASETRFYQFYWGNGIPQGTYGDILFWVDVDGAHVEMKPFSENGQKLYLSKDECFKDNVQVVDFGDMEIERKGEYTIKREFTVKAGSQEEAESIIDEAINKAYKEQFK
jgi:hypothetical protein